MIKTGIIAIVLILSCSAIWTGSELPAIPVESTNVRDSITLKSYYSTNPKLDARVDSVFNALKDEHRIAQLLMPAVGPYGETPEVVRELIREGKIGGVLMLNGSKDGFKELINEFNTLNGRTGNLPFLYSADAEPSLVNRKIKGSTPVSPANEITSVDEAKITARIISNDLNEIGINYNFSPVVDMASNKTVGYRGFGADPKNIIPFSNAFIETTQQMNIIATAKHFPGHGLVSGDTHKALQVINGPLRELKNYPPLIENGVLSIMVAHIAVTNNPEFNTHGMPATTSEKIVGKLLRDSLGFDGLIVTDAMNMGGVAKVKNADFLAVNAGCDIVLMPLDVNSAHEKLLKSYKENDEFKQKVDLAVKRIIRMKICLGLIDE